MEEDGSKKQQWYKLEIPKLGGGVVEEDDDDELEEGEIREEPDSGSKELKTSLDPNPNKDVNIKVCVECSKEFSSGKALGGHMRIHSIPPHKKSNHNSSSKMIKTVKIFKNMNKTEQKPDYMSKCTDENGRPFCVLCGKNFQSLKSLFGHMRCHPEREWRGIIPPDDHASLLVHNNDNHKSSLSSSLSSTDDDVDYDDDDGGDVDYDDDDGGDVDDDSETDLPKWAVRAKRGRKVEVSSSSEEEEVQLMDAVEDLMRLAKGDDHDQGVDVESSNLTIKKQRVDENEATNSNSVTIKDDSGLKNMKFDEESHEKKAAIEMSDELSDNNELMQTMTSNTVSTSPSPNKMKRKRKMKMMMDLEPGPTSPDKYKCNTCHKSFPTHQALGGHRSSHNKFKITIMNAVVDKEEEGRDEDNGSNENNVKLDQTAKESSVASGSTTTNTHQCTICNKVFPTGQALGGHKRCHWTGPPPAADQADPPSSQLTSSPGEASQTIATEGIRRVLEFDLNEEPPMEEEGGGDNGNNGYASSSYNSNIG